MAGWYLAAIAAFALWVAVLPDAKTDGSCNGLGFGCTPTPRDTALMLGYASLPALLFGFAISCITLAIRVHRARSGLAAGSSAALIGFAVTAVGICAVVAMATSWPES